MHSSTSTVLENDWPVLVCECLCDTRSSCFLAKVDNMALD